VNKPARSNILPMQNETRSELPPTKPRRFKARKWLLVGTTAWAAYVFLFVQSPSLERLDGEQQQLNEDIRHLQQANQELEKRIQQLQDPEYIAEIARKKYMMVKPGETLFVEPKQ